MTTENRGADACSDHGLGPDLGRRRALWMLGAGLAVTACGAASSDDDSSGSSGDGTGGSGTTDAGSSSGGTSESGSSSSGEVADTGSTGACGSATAWATGGTAAMTMKSCYPDPFAAAPATCTLICSTTEGPCTTETTIEREDVSEGYTGLPVRMGLRFVDEDCNPVVGASVQIWHTKLTGVYSGVTPSGMMCYGDEPDAEDEMFFRGSQTTDADGVVYFDTCFPGWYSGRAVHVHFQAQIDDSSWIVSQLLWDDAMVAEVFAAPPPRHHRRPAVSPRRPREAPLRPALLPRLRPRAAPRRAHPPGRRPLCPRPRRRRHRRLGRAGRREGAGSQRR